MLMKGCSNWTWLTRNGPPRDRPRNQAKNPAHIENTPTYSKASHEVVAIDWVGQVSQAPGRVMGKAITQTQLMTFSEPRLAVTLAPAT